MTDGSIICSLVIWSRDIIGQVTLVGVDRNRICVFRTNFCNIPLPTTLRSGGDLTQSFIVTALFDSSFLRTLARQLNLHNLD